MSKYGRGRCHCCGEFLGGWWGGILEDTLYLTRLPVERADATRRNALASVKLSPIVDGDVTYHPVSVAGSQYADGTGMNPSVASVVWFQVNYAPSTDLETTQPRAGLAVVTVASAGWTWPGVLDHQATLVSAWLIEDAEGDPYYWDAEEKLCYYRTRARRTCVGPSYFAYYERNAGGNDSITYWAVDQVQPTTASWENQEESMQTTAWKVMAFSTHQFPMALWHRVTNYTAGEWVQRRFRIGKANLPGVTLSDELETRGSVGAVAYGPDSDFFKGTINLLQDEDTYLYCHDWDSNCIRRSSTTSGDPPVTTAPFQYHADAWESGDLADSNFKYAGGGSFVSRAYELGGSGIGGEYWKSYTEDGLPHDWNNYIYHSDEASGGQFTFSHATISTPTNIAAATDTFLRWTPGAGSNGGTIGRIRVGAELFNVDAGGLASVTFRKAPVNNTPRDLEGLGSNLALAQIAPAIVAWHDPAVIPSTDSVPQTVTGGHALVVGLPYDFGEPGDPDVRTYWGIEGVWEEEDTGVYPDPFPLTEPPRGSWYNTSGVLQENGPLAYDGSVDDLHPYYTPPS